MKYYTIYKITNKINGKYYIGKHITENIEDNYMGSGKLIKLAIEKYGKENFIKEILKIYDNEHDMNIAESIMIDLYDNLSYNLQSGGIGGWSYVNDINLSNTEINKQKKSNKMKQYWNEERKQEKSNKMKEYNKIKGTSRYSKALKKRYSNTYFLDAFTLKMKEVNKSLEKRQKSGKTITELWNNNKEFKEKMKNRKPRGSNGDKMKEKWKDPIWREKMLNSRKKGNIDETNKNN